MMKIIAILDVQFHKFDKNSFDLTGADVLVN